MSVLHSSFSITHEVDAQEDAILPWTSIPTSYNAGAGGIPRLPYPQSPPLLYDRDFSPCGNALLAGSDWIRNTTGWTSIPASYNAGSGGIPRLPYPQFPPFLYDGDFFRCGYPSCFPTGDASPELQSSTSVQSSSAQTASSGFSGRIEYQTGVQPPTN